MSGNNRYSHTARQKGIIGAIMGGTIGIIATLLSPIEIRASVILVCLIAGACVALIMGDPK